MKAKSDTEEKDYAVGCKIQENDGCPYVKRARQQTPILFCCDCKTNYALICGECNKKELEATMQQTAKEILNAVQANLVWSDYNFKAFRKIKKKYLSDNPFLRKSVGGKTRRKNEKKIT